MLSESTKNNIGKIQENIDGILSEVKSLLNMEKDIPYTWRSDIPGFLLHLLDNQEAYTKVSDISKWNRRNRLLRLAKAYKANKVTLDRLRYKGCL